MSHTRRRTRKAVAGLLSSMVVVGTTSAGVLLSAVSAQAGTAPGCTVTAPDAHVVRDRIIDVDYLFKCDNPRIRYVKATLSIKRHRGGLPDATVKSYQFDNFTDPTHAGINSSLRTDGACERGKRYHGDITVNVSLNADQQYTETRRGNSVTCN